MSVKERIKTILENAGLDYISNSTVDDIIRVASTTSNDSNYYELEEIKERLEMVERHLGIDND